MTAERLERLHRHNTRIDMLHSHLGKRQNIAITNPLNDPTRRNSDMFPMTNFRASPLITGDLKSMLDDERLQETIRRDLVCLRQAQFAIIDLTYLENNPEILTLMQEVRLLDIPHLFTRESDGRDRREIGRSALNERCFLACYSDDEGLRRSVDDALTHIFFHVHRDEDTNPQIPSKILELKKRA